jgi:SOS-response transcriptional repressor LexA
MKKPKYPNGLKAAMDRASIGPTALGEAVNTSKQNITRWASGDRKLTVDWAQKIAPRLQTTPEELLIADGGAMRRVALLSWVSAGRLAEAESQIPVEDVPLLAFADLGPGDFFALKVEGDSMNRVSPEGSIIVVNRADREPQPGKAYVFWHRLEGTTYKFWHAEPDYLEPHSTNPVHKPIFIKRKKDLEVVGRVRRTLLDL